MDYSDRCGIWNVAELLASRFAEFFEALWENPPFAWQRELAERVISDAESPWPQVIALPTAAGKTACIDIAVFAMAAGMYEVGQVVRTRAPRRAFFVVDRRVIVDEAHERAETLAGRLARAKDGILREVADTLRQIAYGRNEGWENESPVLAFQLRGGMYRSEAWARSPLQPIVVASTVDQVGSRLLFRAYGRGPGMWPVFAGLIANDSLIFLDEAHCARPFLETLQAVARYRNLASEPVLARFSPIVLSATPPIGTDDVFRDTSREPSDLRHPLGRRQLAHKPAALLPVIKTAGKRTTDPFAEALAQQAIELAREGRKAVVIFVNRVATARATHTLLRQQHDAVLLTGRMRAFDKDDTVRSRIRALSAKSSETRRLEKPLFIVATQTLEVGADLDFDALVTECASLDALRQRFGRLNRMGRDIPARAAILMREENAKEGGNDPVYGPALGRTWAWLQQQAGASAEIDFGIAYLDGRLPTGDDLGALTAPSPSAPVMLPAHLDVLAQTSPVPWPSPDVALFLHGPGRASTDVQVCWRTDLELRDSETDEEAKEVLIWCPPASAECLPAPISRFRGWLNGQDVADESADVEGEASVEDTQEREQGEPRRVIRWRGRDDVEVISDPSDLRPGDVIVIPRNAGDWASLGDLALDAQDQPVLDWGDRAFVALRARAMLRLHPELIKVWPVSATTKDAILLLIRDAEERLEADADGFVKELQSVLSTLGEERVSEEWHWLRNAARSLARDRKLARNLALHPFGGLLLKGGSLLRDVQSLPTQEGELADTFSDEHDSTASGTVAVPLAAHLMGVAKFARRFGEGVGLQEDLASVVELAGRVHDLGKADPRFQGLMLGGRRFATGGLLAKSSEIPQGRSAFERARRAAGYPQGGRHELLSVRLAEHAHDFLPADHVPRELLLHLIASHHGYCRPFAPVIVDETPVDVRFELLGTTWSHSSTTGLEKLDSGVSDRFWTMLRRYGWWGMAWLEAILRLADHRCSEWEQDQDA